MAEQYNCDSFTYYIGRDLRTASVLISDLYSSAVKEKVFSMLANEIEADEVLWYPDSVPGYNTDYIYGKLVGLLGFATLMTDSDAETALYLEMVKAFLDRFLTISPGTRDGIKADSLGYHHWTHYVAYMYAFETLANYLPILDQTRFQISSDSYLLLRDSVYGMLIMGNDLDLANSLSGRHPLSLSFPMNKEGISVTKLVNVSEWILGDIDSTLASAYNREWGSTDFGGIVESFPEGFWQFNSGGFGIYRQDDWVTTLKGFSEDYWGAEIYSGANRYGRYQSYGAVEIMYPGGRENSGVFENGWDWNKVPGATTIHLPFSELAATFPRQDERTDANFVGAVRFQPREYGLRGIEGEIGLFAMDFIQRVENSCRTAEQEESGDIGE